LELRTLLKPKPAGEGWNTPIGIIGTTIAIIGTTTGIIGTTMGIFGSTMGIMWNIIGTVRIGFITATDSGITSGDIGPTGTASTFFTRSNRRAPAGQQAQAAEFSGYAENVFLARNMRVDAYGIRDLRAS
jgi:hypothetical protein